MEKSTRKSLCTKRWSRRPESQDLQKDQLDKLWTRRKDGNCSKNAWKRSGSDATGDTGKSVTSEPCLLD